METRSDLLASVEIFGTISFVSRYPEQHINGRAGLMEYTYIPGWIQSPHLLQTVCLAAGLQGLEHAGIFLQGRGELSAVIVVEASP